MVRSHEWEISERLSRQDFASSPGGAARTDAQEKKGSMSKPGLARDFSCLLNNLYPLVEFSLQTWVEFDALVEVLLGFRILALE